MGSTKGPGATKLCTLTTLTEKSKRWVVFGIALNHVLVPSIRPILEQEILAEYNNLKSNHGIAVQVTHSFPAPKYPTGNAMKYENINANDTKLKLPHNKKYDYSKFDYRVASHVDFGKLFLQNHMAKFNAFNETCDSSAVLSLLGRIPVFSAALQNAANVVREGRNAWGHCNFTEWDKAHFTKRFGDMKNLVKEFGLPPADETKVLEDLDDWEHKGVMLCMNATIDAELAKVVQQHVCQLSSDFEKMTFENQEEMNNLKMMLENIQPCLQELEKLQQEQSSTSAKLGQLQSSHEVVQQRVTKLEDQKYYSISQTSSYYFSTCKADMDYYVERYDPDTRQWLLDDFHTWFNNPDKSRAYVLLGDAAVGKSVMAAVIAQRAKNDGNLAAAYFCRHYDGTRRDPRYLLGTVAYQMCNCNSEYDKIVGGETGIQNMLANSKLGVHELFTTLLEEPLSKCRSCEQKLVVIDALDEAEYWSRDDFLDLIMNRFPLLPNWLLFFITSRPEDTVQFRLSTYNPCIRICAGNSESVWFYQQHEHDIQRFLEKGVDFSNLPYSPKEIAEKCNGMFLYAFYIVEILNNPARLNGDIFPETINDYFRKNFKRVYETVGGDFYKKLFGCVLMAPSPLPISFISFLLRREGCALDEQQVIDAVSLFVRTTNQTFTFLHSLIPAWLTDEQKASRRLFIDRNEANALFRDIIVVFLNDFLQDGREIKLSVDKPDSVKYILDVGFRFLCKCCAQYSGSSKTVFNCLTNYRFLQQRIQSNKVGIYSLIKDLEFSIFSLEFDERERPILDDICLVLKQDKYVIAGCPELLYSCLSNASKLTQEKIMLNKVSTTWMEPSINHIAFSLRAILCGMHCCAFSHDKKLFAGGQGWRVFMFDARTFEKKFDLAVPNSENLSHLEFSPDDEFVFFGRLDKCVSVQKGRVVDVSLFSENSECYKWGSYIYDGSYIAIVRNEVENVHRRILGYICLKWLLEEIGLEQDGEYYVLDLWFQVISYFLRHKICCDQRDLSEWFHSFPQLQVRCSNSSCKLCTSYIEFERTEKPEKNLFVKKPKKKPVRDLIVYLYADIFEYQIWNVKTGRPVIEEMFSTQLKPFFYTWHFLSSFKMCEIPICGIGNTIRNVAVLNTSYYLHTSGTFMQDPCFLPKDISSLSTNMPAQCYNHILNHVLSQDGKWLAVKNGREIKLFQKLNEGGNILENQTGEFSDIENHCFTSDSNFYVYVTHKPNQNLYAFALQTETSLQSISGFCPCFYESEKDKRIGYIFCDTNERMIVSLGDLPEKFLLNLLYNSTITINPVDATFTSADTIMFLCRDAMLMSWKVGHGFFAEMLKLDYLRKIHVTKCAFSHDGKLIAIHHSCEMLLFNCEEKFLSSVFKFPEKDGHTASGLTFSADDSLLLFCIQECNDNQSFYVWDIKNPVFLNRTHLPFKMPVDCCCFAQDNSKMFFCNASGVFILQKNAPSRTLLVRNVHHRSECSHCAVSFDNKLLVCCIGNEILLHPLDGLDGLFNVPHNHSGRVESCKFLKGNRYLISHGIDDVVFLFDLSVWKSVAYARQESIISMAVSPGEEKVVCLRSSGDVSVINLHGLKCGLPSNFQLPSDFRLPDRNREPQERQVISPPVQSLI